MQWNMDGNQWNIHESWMFIHELQWLMKSILDIITMLAEQTVSKIMSLIAQYFFTKIEKLCWFFSIKRRSIDLIKPIFHFKQTSSWYSTLFERERTVCQRFVKLTYAVFSNMQKISNMSWVKCIIYRMSAKTQTQYQRFILDESWHVREV